MKIIKRILDNYYGIERPSDEDHKLHLWNTFIRLKLVPPMKKLSGVNRLAKSMRRPRPGPKP